MVDNSKEIASSRYKNILRTYELIGTVTVCTGSAQVQIRWNHSTKKGNFHEIFNLTENERPLAGKHAMSPWPSPSWSRGKTRAGGLSPHRRPRLQDRLKKRPKLTSQERWHKSVGSWIVPGIRRRRDIIVPELCFQCRFRRASSKQESPKSGAQPCLPTCWEFSYH